MVNGFSHGGSNVLINLLLTHPNLCYPGETHKAIAGGTKSHSKRRRKFKRVAHRVADLMWGIGDITQVYKIEPRLQFSRTAVRWFRNGLLNEKTRARHESHNLWIRPDQKYDEKSLLNARLLLKNNNGLVQQTILLEEAFPGSMVYCLFRHPFGLFESHLRKGRDRDLLLALFRRVWDSLVQQAGRNPERHMIIRFEDILANPRNYLQRIYDFIDLDLSDITSVRLQHKPHYKTDGSYGHAGSKDRQVVWYPLNEFAKHLDPEANLRSIRRLDPEIKAMVTREFGDRMSAMGYLPEEPYVVSLAGE